MNTVDECLLELGKAYFEFKEARSLSVSTEKRLKKQLDKQYSLAEAAVAEHYLSKFSPNVEEK